MINVAGVGNIGLNGNVENSFNWAPRLGAHLSADREDGAARRLRPQLRHRRVRVAVRSQRDAEPAGPVGAGAEPAAEFREHLHPARRARRRRCSRRCRQTASSALPNGVFARARCRPSSGRRASTRSTSRCSISSPTRSRSRRATSATGATTCSAGDGPATNVNQAILTGFPTVPTDLRRPFFAGNVPNTSGYGGAFGWTQGIDYFCNCASNAYDSLQAKLTKRFSGGYSVQSSYTLQRAIQDSADYFFFDSTLNRGPGRLGSEAQLLAVGGRRSCRSAAIGSARSNISSGLNAHRRRLAGEHHMRSSRAACRSASPIATTAPTATPAATTGRTSTGDPGRAEDRRSVVQRDADRIDRQRLLAAGGRHVRQSRTQRAARSGLLASRRLALQALRDRRRRAGSKRGSKAVNLFNNVNLANPDSEVGVPGNPEPECRPDQRTAFGGSRSDAQLAVRAEVRCSEELSSGELGLEARSIRGAAFRGPAQA